MKGTNSAWNGSAVHAVSSRLPRSSTDPLRTSQGSPAVGHQHPRATAA